MLSRRKYGNWIGSIAWIRKWTTEEFSTMTIEEIPKTTEDDSEKVQSTVKKFFSAKWIKIKRKNCKNFVDVIFANFTVSEF